MVVLSSGVGVVPEEQPCQISAGRIEGKIPVLAICMFMVRGAHSHLWSQAALSGH